MSTPKDSEWKKESAWNKIFNWRLVRGFGQSTPATISMFAPFIGYAIIYHADVVGWLGGLGGLIDGQRSPGTCSGLLPFNIKLGLTYLGLLFLGVGAIIYRVVAPEVVKGAATISDYVISTVDIVTARNLRSMYVTVRSRRPDAVASIIERAPWLDRNTSLRSASDALRRDENNHIKIDVLRSYYNVLDRHTSRFWVYVVVVFFSIGFFCLATPGVEFSGRVICSFSHDVSELIWPPMGS